MKSEKKNVGIYTKKREPKTFESQAQKLAKKLPKLITIDPNVKIFFSYLEFDYKSISILCFFN